MPGGTNRPGSAKIPKALILVLIVLGIFQVL
jgi:hypothetical protein